MLSKNNLSFSTKISNYTSKDISQIFNKTTGEICTYSIKENIINRQRTKILQHAYNPL